MSRIYLNFLIVALVSGDYLTKFNGVAYNERGSDLFLRLLNIYDRYYVILHVDNATRHVANVFLARHAILTTIYNHDLRNAETMTRPGASRCLNLAMFTDPFVFSKYLKNHNNVYSQDVIMFLSTFRTFSILEEKHDLLPNLSKSGRVILIKFDRFIEVHTMCYYCGNTSGRLLLTQRLDYGQFIENPVRLFPYDFRNLNAHRLRVVYVDYFPYIYCVRKSGGICERALGSERDLLQAMSRYFNFTYDLIEAPNSSYDSVVAGLVAGDYDMAIGGISVTNTRSKILQFSHILRFEDMAFMFVYDKMAEAPTCLFENSATVALLAVVLLIAAILYLVIKKEREIQFQDLVAVVMRGICEQPVKLSRILPKSMLPVIYFVLGSWYLFTIIVNVVYKSKQNAHLVQGPPIPATLDELVADGYSLVVDKTKLNIYRYMLSPDEMLLLNSSTTVHKSNLCDLVRYVNHHKAIISGEIAHTVYHTKWFCSPPPLNRFSSKTFTQTPHAWAFKTSVPFVSVFSARIRQIIGGGLLTIWKERALVNAKIREYEPKVPEFQIVSLSFWLQFVGHLSLLMFSTLVLLVEIVYHRVKQRKRNSVIFQSQLST